MLAATTTRGIGCFPFPPGTCGISPIDVSPSVGSTSSPVPPHLRFGPGGQLSLHAADVGKCSRRSPKRARGEELWEQKAIPSPFGRSTSSAVCAGTGSITYVDRSVVHWLKLGVASGWPGSTRKDFECRAVDQRGRPPRIPLARKPHSVAHRTLFANIESGVIDDGIRMSPSRTTWPARGGSGDGGCACRGATSTLD